MERSDPFGLERFVAAQDPVIESVLEELRAGRKRTHWMWFVFPQLRGLGRSPLALYYGIGSLDEARAYLAHPVLGERLTRCAACVLAVEGRSLREIFGTPDDLKFRSSMTLFALASQAGDNVFTRAIAHYCDGLPDPHTERLAAAPAQRSDV
jgi:uncharacterized protein (DUF1810 family)